MSTAPLTESEIVQERIDLDSTVITGIFYGLYMIVHQLYRVTIVSALS